MKTSKLKKKKGEREKAYRALALAFNLRETAGQSWGVIAQKTWDANHRNTKGELYTPHTLEVNYRNFKDGKMPKVDEYMAALATDKVDTFDTPEEPVIVDKPDIVEEPALVDTPVKPTNVDIVDISETPPVSADTVTREELIVMMNALEDRLTNLVDTRLKGQVATSRSIVTVNNVDEPPLPPKTGPAGKKFLGAKDDIRTRCDDVLVSRFESYAEQHFGGNLSRAMDAVLWNFFGKPRLSFEGDSNGEPETDTED